MLNEARSLDIILFYNTHSYMKSSLRTSCNAGADLQWLHYLLRLLLQLGWTTSAGVDRLVMTAVPGPVAAACTCEEALPHLRHLELV